MSEENNTFNGSTPGINVIWSDHRNLKEQVSRKFGELDTEIEDLRNHLSSLDKKFDLKFTGFDDKFSAKFTALDDKMDRKLEQINQSIGQVTSSAINAMPKWASDSINSKNNIITGLFTIIGAMAGVIATIVLSHPYMSPK